MGTDLEASTRPERKNKGFGLLYYESRTKFDRWLGLEDRLGEAWSLTAGLHLRNLKLGAARLILIEWRLTYMCVKSATYLVTK
jgi:hypothetical protein